MLVLEAASHFDYFSQSCEEKIRFAESNTFPNVMRPNPVWRLRKPSETS